MSGDDPGTGGVVMLSGDLMFASRVKAAAERKGRPFQLCGSLPQQDLSSLAMVIVDLSTRSGVVPSIARECADRCPEARLVAFGPHVQAEQLEAARAAGIPTVMTNGQFDRQLPELLG